MTRLTWGRVIAGDMVLSPKTGRWYEVTGTVLETSGKTVKVRIQGNPSPVVRGVDDPVDVKRGELGRGADLFQVLWSG